MKLLLEISDQDLGSGDPALYDKPYRLRKAARAVIFNDAGLVSMQFVSKNKYHKLPGGGLEAGESIIEALRREIREEVGCEVTLGEEIGAVIEYRNKFALLQMSYCYVARVSGAIGQPAYEEDEIAEGLQPMWIPLTDAIKRLGADQPEGYEGPFIVKRDLAFLEAARNILTL